MQYWSLTDPGCVRTQNQDAYDVQQLDRNTLLCVVCDGMGGAKAGNVASAMAAEEFVNHVKQYYHGSMGREARDQLLEQAVKQANFAVYDQSRQSDDYYGMGTTLVAALIHSKGVTIVNVGDSRVYRIDADGICQLTVDHSLVQLMLQRGELTAEQARFFPGKNYITRAIGTEPTVKCDIFHTDLKRGDSLLLCSDGLTNLVDDQEILFEIVHGVSKEHCCQRLLDIAKNRGAPDNVTSVLIQL
ncbi:MAG: Stp1/IreP family PP2C-type Ser/Thr phosphatase [Oscillospiraceae bacterium]|nr:Stp1/IreP family PP2C-type Ser/Thr phosphatase [Oscillospiraceae bacterium]